MYLRPFLAAEGGLAVRGIFTSFAASYVGLACVGLACAACSAGADGDPSFDGPPTYSGSPGSSGNTSSLGGSGNVSGSLGGSSNLGGNGELTGNPPVSNGAGGNTNTGNTNGQGGSAAVPASGGAGPGNMGGSGGADPVTPVLPGGFYLIDDFQGARDPGWTESEVGGGAGTFTLDTTLGANGSSSSLRVDANNQFHTMLQFALPAAVRTVNEVYGRVYLRLAATPSPNAHYVWVEVGTTANDGHEMRLGHNVGRLQSNHYLNGEQDIRDRNRSLVADTWYCLEFFMGNGPEQLRVWLDGAETALSTTNYIAGADAEGNSNPVADFIPELQAFRIGWELQNGSVWFDDVALADSQIGCE